MSAFDSGFTSAFGYIARTTDVLGLTKLREAMRDLLQAELPADIGVFDSIPDSIAPPSVYVAWSNPWLVSTTFCQYVSNLQLICVAARIEPGGQYAVLESMVGEILTVLQTNHIAVRDATSPYPLALAGVNYLAASINIVEEIGG